MVSNTHTYKDKLSFPLKIFIIKKEKNSQVYSLQLIFSLLQNERTYIYIHTAIKIYMVYWVFKVNYFQMN